jgi:DNA-directed RNA polymerase subunit beta'
VLTDAASRGADADNHGRKAQIGIGHLIPAGTGMYRYQDVEIEIAQPEGFEALPPMAAELPNVFSMADDDESPFPPLPRSGVREET